MAKSPPLTFGDRLRSLREGAGLSLRVLAEEADLSFQAIHMLEQGHRDPTWNTVCRLADALGVPTDRFRS